jgi:hypothetical protein
MLPPESLLEEAKLGMVIVVVTLLLSLATLAPSIAAATHAKHQGSLLCQ